MTSNVPVRESPLPWQRQGLQQTASGYGKRLATPYMVQVLGRWHRVYSYQFSNIGTLYIGASIKAGFVVELWRNNANVLQAEIHRVKESKS